MTQESTYVLGLGKMVEYPNLERRTFALRLAGHTVITRVESFPAHSSRRVRTVGLRVPRTALPTYSR